VCILMTMGPIEATALGVNQAQTESHNPKLGVDNSIPMNCCHDTLEPMHSPEAGDTLLSVESAMCPNSSARKLPTRCVKLRVMRCSLQHPQK
jgi:hypothetical protein